MAFTVRPALESDRLPMARLFAEVAEERDGIAGEPPVDIEARAAAYTVESGIVAEADGELIGNIAVIGPRFGHGEIAMLVAREWRGRGVGSALMAAALDLARERGMHKLVLDVFPHNAAGIALYEKFGFQREGYRPRHIRRASGELWDIVEMGLFLSD